MATLTHSYTFPAKSPVNPNDEVKITMTYYLSADTSNDNIPYNGSGWKCYSFYITNFKVSGKTTGGGILAAKVKVVDKTPSGGSHNSDDDVPDSGLVQGTYGNWIEAGGKSYQMQNWDSLNNGYGVYSDEVGTVTVTIQLRDVMNSKTTSSSVTLTVPTTQYAVSFDTKGGTPSIATVYKNLIKDSVTLPTTTPYIEDKYFNYWGAASIYRSFQPGDVYDLNQAVTMTAYYQNTFYIATSNITLTRYNSSGAISSTGSYLSISGIQYRTTYDDSQPTARRATNLRVTVTANGVTNIYYHSTSTASGDTDYVYPAAAIVGNFNLDAGSTYTANITLDFVYNSTVLYSETITRTIASASGYSEPTISITSASRSSISSTGSVTFTITQTHATAFGNATIVMRVGSPTTAYYTNTVTNTSASNSVQYTTSSNVAAVAVTISVTITDGTGKSVSASKTLAAGTPLIDATMYADSLSFGEQSVYYSDLRSAYMSLTVTGSHFNNGEGYGYRSMLVLRPSASLVNGAQTIDLGMEAMYSDTTSSTYAYQWFVNTLGTYRHALYQGSYSTYAYSLYYSGSQWMELIIKNTATNSTYAQSLYMSLYSTSIPVLYVNSSGYGFFLNENYSYQTANYILAAPNGSAGKPSFRAMVAADIPSLDASKIGTGTFSADRIPSLAASKITSGTFSADRIPSLNASKITSGTFGTGAFTFPGQLTIAGHSSSIGTRVANSSSTDVTLTTATWKKLTSISLDAGQWVVTGTCSFASNATGVRAINTISTAAAADESSYNECRMTPGSTSVVKLTTCTVLTLSATTTYYLNAYQTSGGNLVARWYGIQAMRIR